MRQFEKEYQLRLKEAQEIGRNLTGQPDLATQLKNMVERMKQMSSMKFLLDERQLERLRSHVIEGFRQLELDLSKNLQHLITKENLHLAKDEEIPEAYRKQVEDYYKALSKLR
jgi:polyphosphate kinase